MSDKTPTGALERDVDDGGWVGVFIRRPIFTIVLNLMIIITGIAALGAIEIRELPDVDRPVVSIRTDYPGASPESIDAQITAIIESAVSRVEGVSSISSVSRYGNSRITVEFTSNIDLDSVAIDVRDAVARVRNQLPDGLDEEPQVTKADADASPVMRLAVSSPTLTEDQLSDYVEDVIEDRMTAVPGVAAANSFGLRTRTIEVRVSQVALASRGLTLQDLRNVIGRASITTPSGALQNATQELIVRADAPVATPEAVGELELNATTKVSDVAFVRWGFEEQTDITRVNGVPAVGLEIIRQAQSNTIAISEGVKQAIEELRPTLPADLNIAVTSDDSIFIQQSIDEVVTSLLLATAIVIIVMIVFLRSFKAALAPAIAIPVSLIGTIAAIWLSGFSINILTLLALVVATGIVVDDAIVVLENISRYRAMGAGPRAAAVLGTRQIVFAVLSTTATLAAVFVPISFMPGIVGGLFSEFGFVLAFAVCISSFVALSLCPMLAARFGTGAVSADAGTDGAKPAGRVLTRAYAWIVDLCLRLRYLVVAICIVFTVFGYWAYQTLPKEITPDEDRGVILARLSTQQGANLQYTSKKAAVIEQALAVLREKGEVTNVLSLIGRGGTNGAFIVAPLADWSKRTRTQQQIQAELQKQLETLPGVSIRTISPNSLGIRGGGQGLRFAIAGANYEEISKSAVALTRELSQTPGFSFARTDYDTTQPQLNVEINREAATKLGVPIDDITTLINTMIDYTKAGELFIDDDIIEIHLKAGGRPINDPGDLGNLFIKTKDNRYVNLSSLVSMKEEAIAPSLGREDRRRSVTVSASFDDTLTIGEAAELMREVAQPILKPGQSIVLLGEAKTLSETTGQTGFVFAIAFLIVFLVLAAQFESILSALVIMFTVPFGLAAAIFAIQFSGGTLNVYSQIGLVLLIGVMAKNGILIVEFADQRRDEGASVDVAIRDAASTRFRAVMMTMISTVLGALPLIFATGAGAESRLALGAVIIGGLGFATIFTLFLTPAVYRIIAPWGRPRADETKRLVGEIDDAKQKQLA